MTALLRKAVSLGPEYVIHGPPKVGQQYATNRSWILDQGASGVGDEGWVRLWAPFYMLFPGERGVFRTPQGLLDERVPPGAGLNSAGKAVLDRLDAEIAWACRDCKNVAVTVYGYPSWSNGTPAIDADSDPHTDALFQPWDRTDRNAWNRWRDNTLGTFAPWGGGNRPDNWKKLYFKLPTDGFGMDSAWGCFFDWLYWRYSPDNPYRPVVPVGDPAVNQQATITAIEYVNEPNLQLWPQMDPPPSTDPNGAAAWQTAATTIQCPVGQMLATAVAVHAKLGRRLYLFGPATSDVDHSVSTRTFTKRDEFTNQLLNMASSLGVVPDQKCNWTQHNYSDIDHPQATTRASDTQVQIQGRWNGYQEGGTASVLLTEGGALVDVVGGVAQQNTALVNAYERVRNTTAGLGKGVGMFTQYLYVSSPGFDSGLRNPSPPYAARPAFDGWKARIGETKRCP